MHTRWLAATHNARTERTRSLLGSPRPELCVSQVPSRPSHGHPISTGAHTRAQTVVKSGARPLADLEDPGLVGSASARPNSVSKAPGPGPVTTNAVLLLSLLPELLGIPYKLTHGARPAHMRTRGAHTHRPPQRYSAVLTRQGALMASNMALPGPGCPVQRRGTPAQARAPVTPEEPKAGSLWQGLAPTGTRRNHVPFPQQPEAATPLVSTTLREVGWLVIVLGDTYACAAVP